MKNNTIAIALASLLVGGVAVAAFQNNRQPQPYEEVPADTARYAEVVAVDPVT